MEYKGIYSRIRMYDYFKLIVLFPQVYNHNTKLVCMGSFYSKNIFENPEYGDRDFKIDVQKCQDRIVILKDANYDYESKSTYQVVSKLSTQQHLYNVIRNIPYSHRTRSEFCEIAKDVQLLHLYLPDPYPYSIIPNNK